MKVVIVMPINYSHELNSEQLQAVTHNSGPLLILAGAGSGKTRALTYKAAHLVEKQGINPSQILLLTFTNKAAEEMQHRLQSLIHASLPFAGTFHRFCAKFLRREGMSIGVSPHFLIYDDADQLSLIKQVILNLGLSLQTHKPRMFLSQIGQAKNELINPEAYANLARGLFQETAAQVYQRYQQSLTQSDALDFDDLLLKTVDILTQYPEIAHRYQQQFHHILVDEYQDTNKAQYIIAKTLASHHQHITAVGDASQSIYRWRGADYRNLEYLTQDFPNLTIIKLEQNYRSTQVILDAAFAVIQHNHTHPILQLWTQKHKGQPLNLFQANDEKHEAEYVIGQIRQQPNLKSAILYRTNAQSRAFEEICIHSGIPYLLVGGVKFYERKEIKDLLAYLRLLINPTDSVSLLRAQKLGLRRLQKFFAQAGNLDLTKTFSTEIFDQVLSITGYTDRFDLKDELDLARIENIKELRAVTTQFENLIDFLENVALVENQTEAFDTNQKRSDLFSTHPDNPIILMTVHAAKGLEFDQVFVVGLEEGLFPHSRSMLEPQELEEERRLCYVALTRAKTHLTLTYAQNRLYFGGHLNGTVSRFVTEIPGHLFQPSGLQLCKNHSSNQAVISDELLDKFLNDEVDIDQLIS